MTELEKMKRAKMYIDDLANGIDPLTGQVVSDTDIINNVRITRCLFYVSGILKKVIDNDGEVSCVRVKQGKKEFFSLTDTEIDALIPSANPISASKVVGIINELVDENKMRKLTSTALTSWLMDAGFLIEITDNGQRRKIPTDAGIQLGLQESSLIDSLGMMRKYVIYDANAQQFIFDNIFSIAEAAKTEILLKEELKRNQTENKGKPWSNDDCEKLKTLYECGTSIKDIAADLKRTRGSIKAKLIKLGYIEK